MMCLLIAVLLDYCKVSNAWRDLFPQVLATYRDGFVVSNKETSASVTITSSKYHIYNLYTIDFC